MPTAVQNLVRHAASGRYYARIAVSGKEVWRSLKTDVLTVAKLRLADVIKEQRVLAERRREVGSNRMTMGDALGIVQERFLANPNRKPRSKRNVVERIGAMKRRWPNLDQDVRSVTADQCIKWAADVAADVGANRYNQMVRILRWALDVAVEYGHRADNPAVRVSWRTERPKRLTLPGIERFKAVVQTIRENGSDHSADVVLFLALTGCRVGEAAHVTWGDVDLGKGVLRVLGHPEEGTKSGHWREVPLVPEAKTLLAGMREKAMGDDDDPVILHKSVRKALQNACDRHRIPRLSNHDLRHLFATRCIESGVDVPTVSRWLGHKDGGALCMRTYGHLRNEHSLAMAAKVNFGGVA